MTFRDDLRAVQRRLGVEDDGLIGPGTVAAMGLALDERDHLKSAAGLAETGAGKATGGAKPSRAFRDASAFYGALRGSFGALDQSQVDGLNRLLDAMGSAGWPIPWVAYGLGTAWHETNKQMQPVEEGYYLGSRAKAHQKSLRYYPWYGRGDVQLTWERNYRAADDELGLGGALIADPDKALDPALSAKILVWGMAGGKYTGKGLGDYLPSSGSADRRQFIRARFVINGQDKAAKIADEAMLFQAALEAGGWA